MCNFIILMNSQYVMGVFPLQVLMLNFLALHNTFQKDNQIKDS